MSVLVVPAVSDSQAPIARRSPLAKIAAALLPGLALLASIDPVAPTVVLVSTLLCVPLCGVTWRALALRAWPLALAVATLSLGNAVFTGRKGGATLLEFGPVQLTAESLGVGAAAGLRVAAIALPGVLAILTIDPVDLADALVQRLRVPARFAYGALAGLRLAPLLATDWQTLGRARRARGLAAGANPVRGIRLFAGKVFGLLVGAMRRATRLAAAMEARGFDSGHARTAAREQRFDGGDAALVAASALVTVAAVGLSVVTGAWNPLLS